MKSIKDNSLTLRQKMRNIPQQKIVKDSKKQKIRQKEHQEEPRKGNEVYTQWVNHEIRKCNGRNTYEKKIHRVKYIILKLDELQNEGTEEEQKESE